MVVVTGGLLAWARESMTATRINRTLSLGLLGTLTTQLVLTLIAWHADLPGALIRSLWMVLYMVSALWASAAVSYALLPAALGYGVAAAGSALYPHLISLCMAGANIVLMVNLLAANRALSIVRDGVERVRQRRSGEPPG